MGKSKRTRIPPSQYCVFEGLFCVCTELFPRGETCEEWLFNHLDSLDQHHNDASQHPGYSTLVVHGVTHTPAIGLFIEQFGFVASKSEAFGFSATKY
jgi:hypothetical protein